MIFFERGSSGSRVRGKINLMESTRKCSNIKTTRVESLENLSD